jgi:glycosyltransferase involved in cell wall biosynthesis
MSTISICIVVKNASKTIQKCLASVAWANEIIVLDSGSTDGTLEICQANSNVTLIQTNDYPGYGKQVNRAFDQASSEWIFSLDADEWLDETLSTAIQHTISQAQYNVYTILRISKFCGRFIKHGAWGNDRIPRLFKRGYARSTEEIVHPHIKTNEIKGQLPGILWHDSIPDLALSIEKMNTYTSQSALVKQQHGKRGGVLKAVFRFFWTFLRSYIFKLGFLDGKEGFILSVATAEGSYYRYLKLMYLQEQIYEKNH